MSLLQRHIASDIDRSIRTNGEILSGAVKQLVDFNPDDPSHRIAYVMLAHTGKQHPTLRFMCPEQHPSVLDYMRIRLADRASHNEVKEITGKFPVFSNQQ